jgi:hypothetical protein
MRLPTLSPNPCTAAKRPITMGRHRMVKALAVAVLVCLAAGCSPRHLLIQGVADELARQGGADEEDLGLAREASAFYLKLSESLLRESPGHLKLAESVTGGFTQYAFAFVAFEAERLEAKDAKAAHQLRQRAARLYQRAQRHGMAALAATAPGLAQALVQPGTGPWPGLKQEQVALAYWTAAAWGGWIALSKDHPDTVADLPQAVRLAQLAYATQPDHAQGALASLMGSFEAARPGGSITLATQYFDQAIRLGAGRNAGAWVAKAEAIALPAQDRPAFEALLQQALSASQQHRDLSNEVMRERALWLLANADDLF